MWETWVRFHSKVNFHSNPKERQCQRMFKLPHNCTHLTHKYPLQCSCLENPRDGGAWWAAVYGVAQSRTRLKRLSSSSSSRNILHLVLKSTISILYFLMLFYFCSVAKSCLTLWPHGLQHNRLSYPSPTPGICSNSCPLSPWCYHLFL